MKTARFPTSAEHAEQANQRAQQADQRAEHADRRAERLLAQLRARCRAG
jgi:hypothetical protein